MVKVRPTPKQDMSKEKIDRILSTYPPVEGKPGYVWLNKRDKSIVKLDVLREAYEEYFAEKGVKVTNLSKVKEDERFKDFTYFDEPKWFDEFAKDIDFARVEIIDMRPAFDSVIGFVGVFEWKSNTIKPLDGDSYMAHMPIYGIDEFTINEQRCISIITDKW